ncbi:MAG: nucleotidyltransferase domain-containing protein, partial [Burkholderiaceae bacterium]|nr:nucleotidyltransferase domain-containing protein [Burkholderiaceae bacterium]
MPPQIFLSAEKVARLTELLKTRVPGLLAVYAFGSRVQGTAQSDSDLD